MSLIPDVSHFSLCLRVSVFNFSHLLTTDNFLPIVNRQSAIGNFMMMCVTNLGDRNHSRPLSRVVS